MLLPEDISLLNENLSNSHGLPPYESLVRGALGASKRIQVIVIALGCAPHLDGKTL